MYIYYKMVGGAGWDGTQCEGGVRLNSARVGYTRVMTRPAGHYFSDASYLSTFSIYPQLELQEVRSRSGLPGQAVH